MRSSTTSTASPHRLAPLRRAVRPRVIRSHLAQPHLASPSRPLGRYDWLTRTLHWIFALAIIYATVIGYALSHITHPALRSFLSQLNMSIATVLIFLFPLRLLWRIKRKEPPALPGMSPLQSLLAHGVHGLLYITLGCVLVSGYLMVPSGYRFFGVITIPTPFAQGPLTDALFLLHRTACAVLASLVILHLLAVIKHQLLARVPILSRML